MTLAWWILPLLLAAGSEEPIRDPRAPGDQAIVERGLVTLRLDPKREAAPGECDDLSAAELVVSIGATRVPVTSVERVPRPERHWLLLDISESAEARRREAKRSAAEYARQVMTPGIDAAALLTVDEDTLLVAGPDTDPEALARRIEAVPAGGSSALRDGLDLVLRQVEGDRHEQLILYWTDGQDNTSLGRAEDLLETSRSARGARCSCRLTSAGSTRCAGGSRGGSRSRSIRRLTRPGVSRWPWRGSAARSPCSPIRSRAPTR
jgi:hypothetical protein